MKKKLSEVLLSVLSFGRFKANGNNKQKQLIKKVFDMSSISFNDETVVYDGNEHEITIAGTLQEGVNVNYKNNKLTDAGAIIATAVFSHNNQNYNEIPNMVASLTIKKSYRVSYIVENKVVHFENLNLGDSYTLYEYVTEKYDVVAWIYDGKEISPNT